MASVKYLLPFLTLLWCMGCGKPQPQPERQAEAVPAVKAPERSSPPDNKPPDNRPVIVMFGDSLSAGFGADPGQSFPDFLQKDLDAGGYRYRIANQGISGDTTSGGLSRTEEAISLKPEVVVLELGGNDGLRGVPVANIRANLEELIQRFQKAGIKVLLAGITLPPNYGPDYVKPFDTMYRELEARYRVPLIPFLLVDVALKGPGLMQGDGIHPTATGNEIVAKTVLKNLEPMLRK